ncbi:MAG: DUF3572 domain-containing protein [Pseudomonadota bacterium]
MAISREKAEERALAALAWLAGNEDLVGVFLGSTGLRAEDVRAQAGDAEFLASVLDFIMMDDAWLIALADAEGWAYTDVAEARAALPGGDAMHWT